MNSYILYNFIIFYCFDYYISCYNINDNLVTSFIPNIEKKSGFGYSFSYLKNKNSFVVGAPIDKDECQKFFMCLLPDFPSYQLEILNICQPYQNISSCTDQKVYNKNITWIHDKALFGAEITEMNDDNFILTVPRKKALISSNITVILGNILEISENLTIKRIVSPNISKLNDHQGVGFSILYVDSDTVISSFHYDSEWKGILAKINLIDSNKVIMNSLLDNYAYNGYSMVYGTIFRNNYKYIISTSPHFPYSYGSVHVYSDYFHRKCSFSSKMIKPFSYFGHGIILVEVDGDGKNEIIVTAPWNNDAEGSVHIFVTDEKNCVSDNNTTFKEMVVLNGLKEKNSLFGYSISSPDDINDDGYNDLFVAAIYSFSKYTPVVFLYLGSNNGISNKYSQIIKVSGISLFYNIHLKIKSFDVDNNGYKDLVVGNTYTERINVFRTRPVYKVNVTMNTPYLIIPSDNMLCKNSSVYICSKLDLCALFTYKKLYGGISYINISIMVTIDILSTNTRGFFNEQEKYKEFILILNNMNNNVCSSMDIYYKAHVDDFSTPIIIKSVYRSKINYYNTEKNCSLEICPLTDSDNDTSLLAYAVYKRDCLDHNLCMSHVQIFWRTPTPYLKGSYNNLFITIDIRNIGEPSYGNILIICYDSELSFLSFDFKNEIIISSTLKLQRIDDKTTRLSVKIIEPFTSEMITSLNVLFKFVKGQLITSKPSYNFLIEFKSETDKNPLDKKIEGSVKIFCTAHLSISGKIAPNYINLPKISQDKHNERYFSSLIYFHIKIMNIGLNFVQKLELMITIDSELLEYQIEDIIFQNSKINNCSLYDIKPKKISCFVSELDIEDVFESIISLKIKLNRKLETKNIMKILATFSIQHSVSDCDLFGVLSNKDVILIHPPVDMSYTSVKWWIILLAVSVGFILLLILIFILMKFRILKKFSSAHGTEFADQQYSLVSKRINSNSKNSKEMLYNNMNKVVEKKPFKSSDL